MKWYYESLCSLLPLACLMRDMLCFFLFFWGEYPVFHWFIGCLFSYFNILESRIGTHIIGQMAIVVFFHRQNAKPSIKTCGISVTGLEGNLREISEVLFESWGTKWLWRALEVKSSCAHCYKASPRAHGISFFVDSSMKCFVTCVLKQLFVG